MKSNLYFLALVPPKPQFQQLQLIKEQFALQYDCKVALRSPPHITLIPPLRLNPGEAVNLEQDLDHWSNDQPGFDLQLDGYGCFSPRVIYLNVITSNELFNFQIEVQQRLNQAGKLSDRDSLPFKPHLTLGTRDLRKAKFHHAWTDLQNQDIKVGWWVDRITLLKHNGKSWDVFHSFGLDSSSTGSGKIQSG